MFHIGMTREQIEAIESHQIHVVATLGAIVSVLLMKGVCTVEELETLKTQAIAMADQHMAQLKAESDEQ